MSRVREVTNSTQLERIQNGANTHPKKVVVLNFSSATQPPCQQIDKVCEQLSSQYPRIVFLRVETEKYKEIAMKEKIEGIPTIIFYMGKDKTEMLKGPDGATLKSTIEKLDQQTNPFSAGGHSLSQPSQAPSASGSSAQVEQERPARRNPWADPNFVPPSQRKPVQVEQKPPPAATSQPSGPSKPNPWSDPSFKPPAASNGPAELNEVAELEKAISMSMEDDETTEEKSSENDPSLVAGINQSFVEQLIGMGFPKLQAEKALIFTKNAGAEPAMNWLLQHAGDVDINEPLTKVAGAPANAAARAPATGKKVWKNVRGAPLGFKEGEVYSDEEEQSARALMGGKKSYKSSAPKEERTTPLTKEEKLQDLEERRERRKRDIAKTEVEKKREREAMRRKNVHDVQALKEAKEETQRKALIERKRRDQARDRARKKAIKDKLKADKERRKREAEERKRIREAQNAQK
eukprot:155187_1